MCSVWTGDCQISNDSVYSLEKQEGVYCKVPLVKWVKPTIRSIQDRFDLNKVGIDFDRIGVIKIISDYSEEDLSFDFYYPKESQSKLKPLIIFAHGGAFLVGGRGGRSINFLCEEFAQRGYATVSIEYRLKALGTFDMLEAGYMAMQDGNAAIKYFRKNASRFGIDSDKIFIAGISSGGMLALHSGHYQKGEDILGRTNQLDDAFGCFDCTGDYVTVDNKVAGVINIVGATTSPNILNSDLPTLHIFCAQDSIVPAMSGIPLNNYKQAGLLGFVFKPLLKAIKRPVVYGPLYLKNNLNLAKHKFVDVSSFSSKTCSHNVFMADNGVVNSNGKESIRVINDWVKNLVKPSIYFPVRNLSANSWTTYNLPSSIVSHSIAPGQGLDYRRVTKNQFAVKLNSKSKSSFVLSTESDLGLSARSVIYYNNSSEGIVGKTDKENSASLFNVIVFSLVVICLVAALMIVKIKLF